MEIFVSLKGMQISLINNVNLEIANIGITDSVPCWTLTTSTGAYKIFNKENSTWLDRKYQEYMNSFNKARLQEEDIYMPIYEMQFDKMQLVRPEKGHLKRYWRPGLKVQYRTSTNLMSLKCAIYKIQIDNQLPGKPQIKPIFNWVFIICILEICLLRTSSFFCCCRLGIFYLNKKVKNGVTEM